VGLKYWLENGCMEGGHHILIGPPWTKTSSASSVREGTPVNQKIAKWRRWLDDIEKQICWDLLFKRKIFWQVQEIIRRNPKINKPNEFYEFLGRVYVDSAVMSVRRQVKIKIQKDSISLARLLKEIHDEPKLLSKAYFFEIYDLEPEVIEKVFAEYAGPGEYIDPNLVQSDLEISLEQSLGIWKDMQIGI